MVYRVIGLMSGSSLDGLDIVFVELQETGGKWAYEIIKSECHEYEANWTARLESAITLNALEYQLLHVEYGHYIGEQVNKFIEKNNLHHQVNLIASHGHTTFHIPEKLITHQLGDGASIAAETQLPVITDLRSMDVALGGQGAPVVPNGEKLLFNDYDLFLNIGGIANISFKENKELKENDFIAFDVCPANRILNVLAQARGFKFDEDGKIASSGKINQPLLDRLNALGYYEQPYPKSLSNSFGVEVIFPLIQNAGISIEDALCTYVEHIADQVKNAIVNYQLSIVNYQLSAVNRKLLITGGGAFNKYLIERLKEHLKDLKIDTVIPDKDLINNKEAVIIALMGVLRWREEYNVLSGVTGAKRNTIGGALWLGTEA